MSNRNDTQVVAAGAKPPALPKPPILAGNRGLVLRTIEDMYRFAQYVVVSGFAPKDITRPEAAVVAMQFGAEVGLPPMQSIQNIAVINGRPAIWGDALKALIMATGECTHFKEYYTGTPFQDDYTAHCEIGRRGYEGLFCYEFSVADAKRAGLWQDKARVTRRSKNGGTYEADNDSPWYRHPKRMLLYRARSFAGRDAFPDVLKGLHLRDDAAHLPPIEVEAEVLDDREPRTLDDVADQMAASLREGFAQTAPKAEPEPEPAPEPASAPEPEPGGDAPEDDAPEGDPESGDLF